MVRQRHWDWHWRWRWHWDQGIWIQNKACAPLGYRVGHREGTATDLVKNAGNDSSIGFCGCRMREEGRSRWRNCSEVKRRPTDYYQGGLVGIFACCGWYGKVGSWLAEAPLFEGAEDMMIWSSPGLVRPYEIGPTDWSGRAPMSGLWRR